MTTNGGRAAIEAMKAECHAAISDIQRGPGCAQPAYSPIARGVTALLRCKIADWDIYMDRLTEDRAMRSALQREAIAIAGKTAAKAVAWILGGLATLAAIAYAVLSKL